MDKKYLTVKEVAKLVGVTPLTIRNWDKAGKLIAHRNPVNNYRVYKTADVDKLVEDIEGSKGKTFPRPPKEPPKPKTKKLMIEEL
ncbi:MAG: MerR family DNA-binding transcriptional regulator [Candidatus Yanofskybacteria bacterium CG10_big_fil_rev_8_21_14_0_10_36_16]|uniref:MerR family DNA-binding transcriptional regulator n=1 Tax=Candidatus Yanofskybacteria bacterium CG10_big_fil_rev_8_21_14_0_10_36_16 TaxID=1975096 RepID=A0A2J0QBZ6_9BACT|nr:MAG: MerR family DNA-binding transcriptional regulator [Candidatus Yanofskybacteria bacterium CG10_big_fil_rev_8_21_14_0_10_36_16]